MYLEMVVKYLAFQESDSPRTHSTQIYRYTLVHVLLHNLQEKMSGFIQWTTIESSTSAVRSSNLRAPLHVIVSLWLVSAALDVPARTLGTILCRLLSYKFCWEWRRVCSISDSYDYRFEGYSVLCVTLLHIPLLWQDFAPFNIETLLHSPLLSYRSVITTSSRENKCLKH